ncbi:hypothetical protein HMPREF1579_01193 [Gardnerella vaginalis JCP8066]|nr:hypothetical protein HMPREF1579_01193 [Gardnerella vaginalis JCP8066]
MLCVLPYFDYNRCANSGKTTLYVVRLYQKTRKFSTNTLQFYVFV